MIRQFWKKRKLSKGIEIDDSVMTATHGEKAMIESPIERKNLQLFWIFIIISSLFLSGRVFYLDWIKGSHYSEISRDNRIRSIVIKAPRGRILDKFGHTLVSNVPSIDVVVIPGDLPKSSDQRRAVALKVSEILGINSGNTVALLENYDPKSINPVLLKENIDQDQVLLMFEKMPELPGIMLEKTAIRKYEDGPIFSQVIGYDGKITEKELDSNPGYFMTDYIGKNGIEKSYEQELKGVYGANQVEIDSMGNIKKNLGVIDPKPGNDLVMNIDEELQKKLFDSLRGIMEETGTQTAAAVAIDPRTGGVLAIVSLPSYDNNLFAKGISQDEYSTLISDTDLPLLNRSIAGVYPPGSTLKPAVAAAALSEGIISENTNINCPGVINIGSWSFRDWKTHGTVSVKDAIAESCDVFFYSLGGGWGNIAGLGMDRMKKYENLFGFGELTGIDIPGEVDGNIPSEEWKKEKIGERWYIGDSYHAAIGQGYVTTTPLQLANYTAAIANGGTLYSPRVVNRIRRNDGSEVFIEADIIRRDFVSKQVLDTVREGMRQTVTSGTAQTLNGLPVKTAGKTGTAQYGTEDKTHGWFISFAPYDDPEIAMAVLVEGGGEGHSSALPVTYDVYKWFFARDKNH